MYRDINRHRALPARSRAALLLLLAGLAAVPAAALSGCSGKNDNGSGSGSGVAGLTNVVPPPPRDAVEKSMRDAGVGKGAPRAGGPPAAASK